MKISGVYQIQSKVYPDRVYIGSAVDIGARWLLHLHKLRHQRHHSLKFQNHFNKYGEEDLQFSILCTCEKEQLIQFEQYFLDFFHPWFNICKVAGSCLGIKRSVSEEHRKNLSNSHLGQKAWNKGKQWSEESKRNMSKAHMGPKPWIRKPVLQYDLGNNFIKEWPSKVEASLTLDINKNNISSCLTNNRGSAGGFIWKRKNVA